MRLGARVGRMSNLTDPHPIARSKICHYYVTAVLCDTEGIMIQDARRMTTYARGKRGDTCTGNQAGHEEDNHGKRNEDQK